MILVAPDPEALASQINPMLLVFNMGVEAFTGHPVIGFFVMVIFFLPCVGMVTLWRSNDSRIDRLNDAAKAERDALRTAAEIQAKYLSDKLTDERAAWNKDFADKLTGLQNSYDARITTLSQEFTLKVRSIQDVHETDRDRLLKELHSALASARTAEMNRVQDAKLMSDRLNDAINVSQSSTEDLIAVLERMIEAINNAKIATKK